MRAKGLIAVVASVTVCAATDWDAAGRSWWSHVQYLASDELEGRNVGTKGYAKAAYYVARQFRESGLQPAGEHGSYLQQVNFVEVSLDESQSKLTLILGGGARREVPLGEVAHLGFSTQTARTIEAPVVFAGYGLVIPEEHWDDTAGLPLEGAVVAYLTGGPAKIPGNLRSHYSSIEERWKALRAKGAVGLIGIQNPKTMEIPWERQSASRTLPRMALSDRDMQQAPGLRFGASWNPKHADELLGAGGHKFAEILQAADSERPLPHFRLPVQVAAQVNTHQRQVTSENVAAVYPGSDPQLRNQYVVISAHLDHLGIAPGGSGDRIYNGAMDDASGVASLLEIARTLGREHTKTERSLLLLAVTGEEKGEQGSRYFAQHPTVTGRLVADLNMDMFLPLFPLRWLEVQGLDESTLGDDIRVVAEAAGVKVQADKEPNRNRFIRSDQYSFIKHGVPALAFKFGYVPGGKEEKVFKNWYTNRYHAVSDDTGQPVDKAAAAQFNAILYQLALRVANRPEAPSWKANSFFRRFATAESSDSPAPVRGL